MAHTTYENFRSCSRCGAKTAAWVAENREQRRANARRYTKTEKFAEAQKQYRHGEGRLKFLVAHARKRARTAGVECTISAADLAIPARCPYLGIPITQGDVWGDGQSTLDRVDPKKGYVPGNVVVASRRANRIKSDATPDELLRIAAAIRALQE